MGNLFWIIESQRGKHDPNASTQKATIGLCEQRLDVAIPLLWASHRDYKSLSSIESNPNRESCPEADSVGRKAESKIGHKMVVKMVIVTRENTDLSCINLKEGEVK